VTGGAAGVAVTKPETKKLTSVNCDYQYANLQNLSNKVVKFWRLS
jgi:hypothetical protein